MFNINFIRLLNNFSLKRETADMAIRSWKSENKEIYQQFKSNIEKIKDGDVSILMEIFTLMKSCTPPEAETFYIWLYEILIGKGNINDIINNKVQWAGTYTEKIAKCFANKKLWLGIDLKSGEVNIYKSSVPGMIMVNSKTPIEIWEKLPQHIKIHLTDQLNKLLRNTKGIMLFCKLEYKMIYQAITFFATLLLMSHAVFLTGFIANLYDKVIEEHNSLSYCMYYFVVFDHGLTTIARLINEYISHEHIDSEDICLVNTCIGYLITASFGSKTETKNTWEKTAEQCSPEIWKTIMYGLKNIKPNRGYQNKILTLDDILIGNTDLIKKDIKNFLSENTENISLAYLLYSLTNAGKINPNTKYMTFHRAIEQFTNRKYSHDVPQKRYGEIRHLTIKEIQYGSSYNKARKVIEKWTFLFTRYG